MSDNKNNSMNEVEVLTYPDRKMVKRVLTAFGGVFNHVQVNPKDKKSFIVAFLTPNTNLFVWGPPGTGKTTLVEAMSQLLYGSGVGKISCNESARPDDIIWETRTGIRRVDAAYKEFEIGPGLREPFRHSIVFFEEGNRLGHTVYQALVPALSSKAFTEQGVRMTIDHIEMFVFDGNPYARRTLDRALKSRLHFGMQMGQLQGDAQYRLLKAKEEGSFKKLPDQAFNEEDRRKIHEEIMGIEISKARLTDLQLVGNVLTRCVKGDLGTMTDEYRRNLLMKCDDCPCTGTCYVKYLDFPEDHRAIEAMKDAAKCFAYLRCSAEVNWNDIKNAFGLVFGHRPEMNMAAQEKYPNSFALVQEIKDSLDDILKDHWNPGKLVHAAVKKLKDDSEIGKAGAAYSEFLAKNTNAIMDWWAKSQIFKIFKDAASTEFSKAKATLKSMADGTITWTKSDLDQINNYDWLPEADFEKLKKMRDEIMVIMKGAKSLDSTTWTKHLARLCKVNSEQFKKLIPGEAGNMSGKVDFNNGGYMDVQMASNGKTVEINWEIADSTWFPYLRDIHKAS